MTTSGGKTSCGDSSVDGRDGQSVVDFGNLDDHGDPPVAQECTWVFPQPGNDNNIIESDKRFNTTDASFYLAIPTGCSNRWDLRGVAIHEFGHSYGMGHVSEDTHEFLTMSEELPPCSNSQRPWGMETCGRLPTRMVD